RAVPYCHPGNDALVTIDALPDQKLPAKVSRIASSEDPETRLMHVEIDLPNPTGTIRNGMYGQVTIFLEKLNALTLPPSFLADMADGKGHVYVVRKGIAHLTPVTIAADNGLQIAILAGFTANDDVILHPDTAVSDGVPVVVASNEGRTAAATSH